MGIRQPLKRNLLTKLSFISALALSSCVLHEQPRNSRFFGDYTDFQKVDFKAETLVFRHPTTRVIDYDKFLIMPVSIYDNPQKKIRDEDRPKYDALSENLRQKLVSVVSKHYQIVDEPGPGVLRMEYAVIDIKPYVWYTNKQGNRTFRADTLLKGSKFELDCHDAQSDERIFAITTLYPGDIYKAYENSDLIPNIESAFTDWSTFLSGLLDRAKKSNAEAAQEDRFSFRPSTSSYAVDSENKNVLVYRAPQFRVTNYKHFYLARPLLEGRPHLTAGERKELELKLRDEAYSIIEDPEFLTNHPGPGILTVRTKIQESAAGYRFALECIDPNQSEMVFGMIETFPPGDLFDTYKEWNKFLQYRWDLARENTK